MNNDHLTDRRHFLLSGLSLSVSSTGALLFCLFCFFLPIFSKAEILMSVNFAIGRKNGGLPLLLGGFDVVDCVL